LFSIVEEKHPPVPDRASPLLRAFLIDGCFIKDPKKRPNAEKLLTHPWISQWNHIPHPDYDGLVRAVLAKGEPAAKRPPSTGNVPMPPPRSQGVSKSPTLPSPGNPLPGVQAPQRIQVSGSGQVPTRGRSGSEAAPPEVAELKEQIRRLTKERDELRRENNDLKVKLEAHDRKK